MRGMPPSLRGGHGPVSWLPLFNLVNSGLSLHFRYLEQPFPDVVPPYKRDGSKKDTPCEEKSNGPDSNIEFLGRQPIKRERTRNVLGIYKGNVDERKTQKQKKTSNQDGVDEVRHPLPGNCESEGYHSAPAEERTCTKETENTSPCIWTRGSSTIRFLS